MRKFVLSQFVKSIDPSATMAINEKAKRLQAEEIKIYNFSAGEPDFPTPENIKEAGIDAIKNNFTKYTSVRGISKLLEAICQKLKKENNLNYTPEEIIVGNGAKEILYLSVRTVCEIGDEIIILAPHWGTFPEQVKLAGGKPVIVKTDDFRPSAKEIKKAITNRTKAIILNSPNNPSGIIYTLEELKELAEIVLENEILVITDEIYEKLLYDETKHYSFAALDPKLKDLTITVNGVSKTYSMTGWRIGYGAGPSYIIKKMADLKSHLSTNSCLISQMAALEALSGNQDSVKVMLSEYDRRRKYICQEFQTQGIEFIKPQGAFYVFFKVNPKFDSLEFCERMLEKFQVALVPGEAFGTPGWVRLSYAVELDDIKEGIKRIKAFFA
ncbi:MAG: aspartate aminotransferase [Candidatus Nealsonbacteria bacterium CG_4_10_14_3_um_filter_36_16]|uniref:Aminotransferase n=1 Tax=Candidatus Nealsonbacteria bacterium CG_4_10_14_3_um_filter_36_16 TaxID=1974685 RepID=A0A2M7MFM1_9BACT|nr:MAG: aspartate aminotransferase [Candidatus Nealsonbacteria bacterium CG_4_10_14_3_um_filter_36_16]